MSSVTITESGLCAKCGERPATVDWVCDGGVLAWARGMSVRRCERCSLEEQLEHARKMAAKIPEIEARLRDLGGSGGSDEQRSDQHLL